MMKLLVAMVLSQIEFLAIKCNRSLMQRDNVSIGMHLRKYL